MDEVKELKRLEVLANRKACLYGRVLTDVTLAEEMQTLAEFHEERLQALAALVGDEKGVQGNEA